MKTTIYVIRHAVAEARQHDPRLGRLGVRQAEMTRDFMAVRPIDHCYSSPMLRAMQTAAIIAEPHGLAPMPLDSLGECAAGSWCSHFLAAPAPRGDFGESFADLQARVTATLENLFTRHAGHAILVVAHHDVGRAYLAGLLGMNAEQAAQVQLDNCGISVIVRDGAETTVTTLNASFHLQGIAA